MLNRINLYLLIVTFTLFMPALSVVFAYNLPDTGQTKSYTDTFGEDSDYTINPPSYTDNGNGTVTDNNTSLMWQQEDDNSTHKWDEATSYCDNLSLAGYSDWRLPEMRELTGIVDYGTYNPAIDETYFPATDTPYWSFTTSLYSTSYAWYVNFYFGNGGDIDKSNSYYVRCVRGGQDAANFTDNGDGTVTDNVTGFMWQQEDDNTKRDWEPAITYCEGLSLAGYSDWRLPNNRELGSIVDYDEYAPAIDETYFASNINTPYWSSTTSVYSTSNAFYVDFFYGNINDNDNGNDIGKSDSYYVRCVRGEGTSGNISVSPTSHDFGDTDVGSASLSQTFTVSNMGDAGLVIDTISLTGTDITDFAIQSDGCSGLTVAPLDTCSVDVVFSPISEGSKSSNLSIPSNDPDTPILDVSLSGTGVEGIDDDNGNDNDDNGNDNDDDGVLSAPANFSASVEECTTSPLGTSCTVSLSWTDVSAASGYKLYYGFSSGSYAGTVDLGNVTSYTFYGVPGGTYYLAVSAYDGSNESGKSEEIALTVGESSIPTNFSATVSDCTEDIFGSTTCTVSLSWTGVSGSSGYYLHYGFFSGNYVGSIDVGYVTSVTYTGIPEATYYLALTSYDSEGVESGYSDELILEVGSNSVNKAKMNPSPFAR